MINLLEETLEVLRENGKIPEDVFFVQSEFQEGSWKEFAEEAKMIDYDESYGMTYIPLDLVVVGSDWWLEREEYEGAEWWGFKTRPRMRGYTGIVQSLLRSDE